MIELFCEEEYGDVIGEVAEAVLTHFGLGETDVSIEISTADKDEMQETNLFHRGVDRPTDVLSFCNIQIEFPFDKKKYPDDVNPEDGSIFLGEIMICPEIAYEQAKEYGHCPRREFAFLTCHGMLHLMGYDHMNEEDEKKMFALQDQILDEMGITRNQE